MGIAPGAVKRSPGRIVARNRPRPLREEPTFNLPSSACEGAALWLGSRAPDDTGPPNACRPAPDPAGDPDLYLDPDRPGDPELAARLRRHQPLQPRRLGNRRLPLSGDRAGIAPDPRLSAEFRRHRHIADRADLDPLLPQRPDRRRYCPLPALLRHPSPRRRVASGWRSA